MMFQAVKSGSLPDLTSSVSSLLALVLASACTLLSACEVPPKTTNDPPVQLASADPAPPPIPHGRVAEPRFIPPDINTAAKAVRAVATLPPIEDIWTNREIALHAALYREALTSIVADNTRHMLLQPALAEDLPALAVEAHEFYLRVLAELASLDRPIAWTTVESPAPGQAEFFPGTRELATRLSFEILERDDAAATVTANVSDATAHTGSSRQRVTATFDGKQWQTTRDGPRLIW